MASASGQATPDPELLRAWDAEQAALAARVVEADPPHGAISIPSDDGDSAAHGRPLRLVGGLDISFASDAGAEGDTHTETETALAALVVLSFPALEVVYEDFLPVRLTQPYVPGYLAFREAPALVDLVRRLRAQRPDMLPDLLMLDGNGVLHPRGCGLACHVGLATGLSAIGVAKTFLHVDGLDAHGVRRVADALHGGVQDWLPLVGRSGRTWGAALRPCIQADPTTGTISPPVRNPIYISIGTGLSLSTAVSIVRACCRHRVPEPIRQADIRSRARIREGKESERNKAMNG